MEEGFLRVCVTALACGNGLTRAMRVAPKFSPLPARTTHRFPFFFPEGGADVEGVRFF